MSFSLVTCAIIFYGIFPQGHFFHFQTCKSIKIPYKMICHQLNGLYEMTDNAMLPSHEYVYVHLVSQKPCNFNLFNLTWLKNYRKGIHKLPSNIVVIMFPQRANKSTNVHLSAYNVSLV